MKTASSLIIALTATLFLLASTLGFAQQSPLFQLDEEMLLFDTAWSPDGQLLAVAASTGVRIYTDELQPVTELEGHSGNVLSVSWSPDGTQLASAGGRGDNSIRIWNYSVGTNTFSLDRILPTETSLVLLVAWSPDGTQLASLSVLDSILTRSDVLAQIDLWDTETWAMETVGYLFDLQPVLTWSADSLKLAVAGEGGVNVSNLTNPALGFMSDYTGAGDTIPESADWSVDNRIALAGGNVTILDGTSGQVINQWSDYPSFLARWHPNGSYLLITTYGASSGLSIFDPATETILRTYNNAPNLRAVDWSSDGSRIVSGTLDGTLEIWDATNLPITSGTPTITPRFTITPFPTPSQ